MKLWVLSMFVNYAWHLIDSLLPKVQAFQILEKNSYKTSISNYLFFYSTIIFLVLTGIDTSTETEATATKQSSELITLLIYSFLIVLHVPFVQYIK